jgi:protein O-mannosyl-transferase
MSKRAPRNPRPSTKKAARPGGQLAAPRPPDAPSGPLPPWARAVLPAAVVACCAVFASAVRHPFALDDFAHLHGNPHLNPPTWAGLRALWTGPYEHLYSPVVYTVWAGLSSVARGSDGALLPAMFHVVCLVVHALNSLAVYFLLRRLAAVDHRAAAAGAALFAVHPLQVEPVVWISGLKDVLFAGFSLAALLVLLAGGQAPARRRWISLAGATALYALALLTKPAAVALPLVAFALERLALGRPRAVALATSAAWAALALPMLWLTREAQPLPASVTDVPLAGRPIVALDTLGFYLGKLLLPLDLAIDYGRKPLRVLSDGKTVATVAFALAAVAACWWAARRARMWGAAGLVFVAALLPTSGLFSFVFQDTSTVADRYAYLALVGPALALAILLRDRGPRAYVVAGAVLALLAARSAVQVRVWRDEPTLFAHAVASNPASYIGHKRLAEVHAAAGRRVEAIEHARRAVELEPFWRSWFHLGTLLAEQGQLDEARRYLGLVRQARPRDGWVRFVLGLIAEKQLAHAEAIEHFQAAFELEPAVRQQASWRLQRLRGPTP